MIRILLSSKMGEKRITQAELARKTNIRPNTINELYHDFAVRVNLDHLDRICRVLQCELSDIIVRVPDPDETPRNTTGNSAATQFR